jgi:hypothetical protein
MSQKKSQRFKARPHPPSGKRCGQARLPREAQKALRTRGGAHGTRKGKRGNGRKRIKEEERFRNQADSTELAFYVKYYTISIERSY